MESGELEGRKIFEETTTNNVKTGIDFANDTRRLFRELEDKVTHLTNIVRQQEQTIEDLGKSLTVIRTKLFSGGTE
jgi:methyl-accepting chemotaxis protein